MSTALAESARGASVGHAHLVRRATHHFFFDGSLEPAVVVRPGERVRLEVWDCFSNRVVSPDQRFASQEALLALVEAFNPLAGPVYVEGAEPGDTLAVFIEAIDLATVAPYAVTVVVPGIGGLCSQVALGAPDQPDTRICPIQDGQVWLPTRRGSVGLPLRPMVGTIGTAPAREVHASLKHGAEFCGNVDCPDVTVGSTLLLPVNRPGALLSLGDVHAAMGDAEITGIALETSADVTIRVDLVKEVGAGPRARALRLETPEIVGSIGCHFGQPVDFNLRWAYRDLLDRLVTDYGLETIEAYELLGAAGRVRVNQCVEGGWSAVLAAIGRDVLPGGARWHTAD